MTATDNFWAIDFETANHLRGSPCALGIVRVEGGQITETQRWLMKPTRRMLADYGVWSPEDYFDDWNTYLHGIAYDTVRDAPTFLDRYRDLVDFVGTDPVVAHNASFDIGVLRDACDIEGSDWPAWNYFCTMVVGRTVMDSLESYSLPYCVAEARARTGAPHTDLDHHDPVADASAAAELALRYMTIKGEPSLSRLLDAQGCRWGYTTPTGEWRGCTKKLIYSSRSLPEVNIDADPEGPLYGLHIVLTGALPGGMIRQQAWDMIAQAGGVPQSNVTKKTDLLIVCDIPPYKLRPGATVSNKQAKAAKYGTETMAGRDFLSILSDALGG